MKKYQAILSVAALSLMLAACNADEEEVKTSSATQTEEASTDGAKTEAVNENATKTIDYLGQTYEVPVKIDKIIAASLESMEDSAVLGIKPVGVISADGSSIPKYLEKELAGATVVGSKREPSTEAMLALDPDVIVSSSKFDETKMANFNKVATTFPYSHISTNWKENLALLGQLAGKEAEAKEAIANYESALQSAKESIATSELKGKDVLLIRVRGGLAVYPEAVYFNPSLYEDLGLQVPAGLAALKAKTETKITYETLAEWNPDVILLQFSEDENTDTPEILKEVLDNPIFNSVTAAKENQVYVNIIDPLAQGGTAWSKINFLNAFNENVAK